MSVHTSERNSVYHSLYLFEFGLKIHLKMKNLNATGCLLVVCLVLSSIPIANCAPNALPAAASDSLIANCLNVKNLFRNEGFYSNDKPKSDSGNLRICRRDRSCCTKGVELNLNLKSKSEFQQKFRHLINNSIEYSLVTWAKQFDRYYLNAIQLGHKEFDLMFAKLYGPRYKENYELFSDLFKSIALYHEKGLLDLEAVLNDFFEKLFVRLFRMLNPNFQFQPEYILCISQTMKNFESFGEIPKNLLTNLKRQLGATRTFVQGLLAGANIIEQLNQIDISSSCGVELMQINYCSLCAGHINLKPCKTNCEATYTKCMANYQDFEGEWNKFLSTIIQFGKRLENTLNLENTLGSINYKVSDVIMFFQEHHVAIRDQVFEKCSVRKLNKREINEDEEEGSLLTIGKLKETRSKSLEISQAWKTLATDVKKKIKSLKSYWSKLPKSICKKTNPTGTCWNGTHSVSLDRPIKPASGLQIQKNSKVYRSIDTLRLRLQTVNNKLISSYNGNGLEDFSPSLLDHGESGPKAVTMEPEEEDFANEDDEDEDYEDKREEINENDQQRVEKEEDNNRLILTEEPEESILDQGNRREEADEKDRIGDNNGSVASNLESSIVADPKNESVIGSGGSSYLGLSLFTLIISQLICRYLGHF